MPEIERAHRKYQSVLQVIAPPIIYFFYAKCGHVIPAALKGSIRFKHVLDSNAEKERDGF